MKSIRYFLEYLALKIYSLICAVLPLEKASNMGARLGWFIGKRLDHTKFMKQRIEKHLGITDGSAIAQGSWENVGRIISEYPHLKDLTANHVRIENKEIIDDLIAKNTPLFFISGHIGNWEVMPPTLLHYFDIKLNSLYREPNNKMVAGLLEKMRSQKDMLRGIPKSRGGAKDLVVYMRKKDYIGFLFDQKYNEGDPIPFLGELAKSYTPIIPLCQKFGYTLVPGSVRRENKTNFVLTIEKPISLFDTDNNPRDKVEVFQDMHKILERWIKERPEEWLWQHRRWGKDKNKA